MPARTFMSVLFPAPFSPTRPWISPCEAREIHAINGTGSRNDFTIPCISSRRGEDWSAISRSKSKEWGDAKPPPCVFRRIYRVNTFFTMSSGSWELHQ